MLTSFFVLISLTFFVEFLFLFPFPSSRRIHIRLRGVNENFSSKSPRISLLSHCSQPRAAFCVFFFATHFGITEKEMYINRGG